MNNPLIPTPEELRNMFGAVPVPPDGENPKVPFSADGAESQFDDPSMSADQFASGVGGDSDLGLDQSAQGQPEQSPLISPPPGVGPRPLALAGVFPLPQPQSNAGLAASELNVGPLASEPDANDNSSSFDGVQAGTPVIQPPNSLFGPTAKGLQMAGTVATPESNLGVPPQRAGGAQPAGPTKLPAQSANSNQSSAGSSALEQQPGFINWRNQHFNRRKDGVWQGPDGHTYTDGQVKDTYTSSANAKPKPTAQSVHASGSTVTYIYADGPKEQKKGTHPQRDNNPGNIGQGEFSKNHGSLGADGKQAIFATPDAGWDAMDANLRTSYYQNKTLDDAIESWAPHYDKDGNVINDTPKYQRAVRHALGLPGRAKVSSLTPQQFETLKHAIAQFEGFFAETP
jgi:hypothetical protein